MIDVLVKVAIVYAIYLIWRLTVGAVLMWRRGYTPEATNLAEVDFSEIPEGASAYFDNVQSELEGFGFDVARFVHLKFYEELMGASGYVLIARHKEQSILAGTVWIRFVAGRVMTNPSFTSWLADDRELMTERGVLGVLLSDIPGQDKVVFANEIPLGDLFAVHELRLAECKEVPIAISDIPADPVEEMREGFRRLYRLSVAGGVSYRHPENPGYCSTFLSVVRLRWRTSLIVRDFTFACHKRRARRWLARVHESREAGLG